MTARQRGLTLTELIIVVAIVGVSLALAVPSFTDVRNKRAVTNAAEQMAAFLSLARTESIRRNMAVTVTLDKSVTPWCAGMADVETDACVCDDDSDASYCVLDELDAGSATDDTVAVLDGGAFELVAEPDFAGNGGSDETTMMLTFDPVRGLLDTTVNEQSAEITLVSANDNYSLRVNMAINGRVDLCTPSDKKVPGYDECP